MYLIFVPLSLNYIIDDLFPNILYHISLNLKLEKHYKFFINDSN